MMKTLKANPIIILLMAILAIVGVATIATARPPAPAPDVQAIHVGDAPPPIPSSQSTANPTQLTPAATMSVIVSPTIPLPIETSYPTQAIPSATAIVTVSPTVPWTNETPRPTLHIIVLPSVVAEETHVWLGPTIDPTQVAKDILYRYVGDKLVVEPAPLVAQGTNTTPIPSEFYTGLTLTTYEVREVTLPQQVTWDAWVPGTLGGLELRPVTFDKAWRVTVKGRGFRSGNNIWFMFTDNGVLGRCFGGNGGLSTIVYDRSLLPEGARLGVTYGFGSLTFLPETLHFPPGP